MADTAAVEPALVDLTRFAEPARLVSHLLPGEYAGFGVARHIGGDEIFEDAADGTIRRRRGLSDTNITLD